MRKRIKVDNEEHTISLITAFTFSPVCVPLTNMAVLGSSTSFGSRAWRARFERAFFGFLCSAKTMIWVHSMLSTHIVRNMGTRDPERRLWRKDRVDRNLRSTLQKRSRVSTYAKDAGLELSTSFQPPPLATASAKYNNCTSTPMKVSISFCSLRVPSSDATPDCR